MWRSNMFEKMSFNDAINLYGAFFFGGIFGALIAEGLSRISGLNYHSGLLIAMVFAFWTVGYKYFLIRKRILKSEAKTIQTQPSDQS